MIEFYKKRGETPLEALNRLRTEQPELINETLSYAGRLDPMAEGILPVLVSEEENKNRKIFLNKDKEYYVELLLGFQTDTGDILGIVTESTDHIEALDKIKEVCRNFVLITEQTYPWYSSKTVDGIPLFVYAQNRNFNIERPTRGVRIYEVEDIKSKTILRNTLLENIIVDIQKVTGDFRQKESMKEWEERLSGAPVELPIISFKISVSSGTYIRALTEYLQDKTGIPNTVLRLVRTRIL